MVEHFLTSMWAVICLFAIGMYVVLDGFDLGIGILFGVERTEHNRDNMMATIAPYWDGNETWLVMAAVGLWAAFPQAFATLIPAVYLPGAVMLLALILRGVSFEFRSITKPNQQRWDMAFFMGSLLAAFCQGLILGTIVKGFPVTQDPTWRYAGNSFEWLTPFSILCGVGVVFGYAVLGCGFLIMKGNDEVVAVARRHLGSSLIGMLVVACIASVWTPMFDTMAKQRLLEAPGIYWVWIIPVIGLLLAASVWKSSAKGGTHWPFFGTVGIFILCYVTLGLARFPVVVPNGDNPITVWNTAADPGAQIFLLSGTLVLIPLILGYTVFNYWTFRGRAHLDGGHDHH